MKKKNIHIDNKAMGEKSPLILADVKMKNPFKVPDAYFDELPSRIVNSVEKSSAKRKDASSFVLFKPDQWAYIGGVAAILIVVFFLLKPTTQTIPNDDGLTLEQIFDENPEWLNTMSDEELLEALYVISDNNMEFEDDLLNFDSVPTEVLDSMLETEDQSYDLLYNL